VRESGRGGDIRASASLGDGGAVPTRRGPVAKPRAAEEGKGAQEGGDSRVVELGHQK